MKEVPFLSKMVYKGLGFEPRGRASRRKLNTLLSYYPPPPPPPLPFPHPSWKKTERLQPFYIQSQIPLNSIFFYFSSTRGKVILEPIIL